ncbi:hypothetical protein VPHF99_0180 [Vibrio phage F99]|nr:hypothetical protein MYOV085v1_p0228 [Vibrio phage 355E48.1]
MLELILTMFLVTILGMCSGIYIRDGQNDHKSSVPLGKKFHYTLAVSMFTIAVLLGVLVCSTLN